MKLLGKFVATFVVVAVVGCGVVGKKGPYQFVLDSRKTEGHQSVLDELRSGGYTTTEIKAVAISALDNSVCALSYEIVSEFQLDVNIRGKYKTLFQCLLLQKEYSAAELLLERGAKPDFLPDGNYVRNNAIEEAAAWGQVSIVKKLLALGVRPTSLAFYFGVSGTYHRDFEAAAEFVELFEPFIADVDVDYVFSLKPLLYEVATNNAYKVEQRRDLCKFLLDHGANVSNGVRRTERGSTRPVDYIETPYMAVRGQPLLTLLFLAYGANPNDDKVLERTRFLANLKPGQEAAQGLVVEIKGDLVLVQERRGQRWIPYGEIMP